jgi:hypothetical protein
MYQCYYCGDTLYTCFNNPRKKQKLKAQGIEENWYPSYFKNKIFICKECNKKFKKKDKEKYEVQKEITRFKQSLDEEFIIEYCCLCDNRADQLHHENYNFWNHFYFICNKCHSIIHINKKNFVFIYNKNFSPNTGNEDLLIHHRKNLEYLNEELKKNKS